MTLVCGTDFSDFASRAVDAAASLAAAWKDELVVVHALDFPGAEEAEGWSLIEAERKRTDDLLANEKERVARRGARVRVASGNGASDAVLVETAARERARLVVVGALGRRGDSLWRLGSTADRVAQTSRVPVLVVREAAALEAWTSGKRPLEVVVGVDATSSSDAAVRWVGELESAGSCRVTCVHVYWPPELKERMHVSGAMPIGSGHADVERALEKELRERVAALRGKRAFELRILGGLGRTGDHLVRAAEEAKADLVVVGAKPRSGLSRLWHGSVSRGVIDLAPMNVACASGEPA